MISENCPVHGPLVVTMKSKASSRSLKNTSHHEILSMTKPLSDSPQRITPLSQAVDLLNQTAKVLKQTNIHGSQATLTGIRTDQLENLEIVVALIEQKQRSLDHTTVDEHAQQDKQAALARMAPLQALARKAPLGRLDAETVLKTIWSDPDQTFAVHSLRQLLLRKNSLSIGDVDVVVEADASAGNPDFDGKRSYSVEMSANSIKSDVGQATCVLQSGEQLDSIFSVRDLGHRELHLQELGDKLLPIGYCMLLDLHFKAEIAVQIVLTAKGLSYKCSLIRFNKEAELLASIRRAIEQQTPGLFAADQAGD